jgi:hypothetical protein
MQQHGRIHPAQFPYSSLIDIRPDSVKRTFRFAFPVSPRKPATTNEKISTSRDHNCLPGGPGWIRLSYPPVEINDYLNVTKIQPRHI